METNLTPKESKPLSREEAIRRGLIENQLGYLADKFCGTPYSGRYPDSIGDRLARCKLNLSLQWYRFLHGPLTDEGMAQEYTEAEQLLAEGESILGGLRRHAA